MAIEIEKEFKNLLTKDEYTLLLNEYNEYLTHHITQTNSYFDYQNVLREHKCALRIRIIEGQDLGEVTLKIPKSPVEVIEVNEKFNSEQLATWIDQKEFPLPELIKTNLAEQGIMIDCVQMIASLKTVRKEGHLNDETLLVLDQSFYNDTCDYELEMEVKDIISGEKLFKELLNKHHIPAKKTASKIVRALSK